MSDIPFTFTAIPNFLIDSGWTDDPKNWKLIRTLFRRCRKDGHVEFVEGRQVFLEPFEFIYGREKTSLACGLTENETRKRIGKIVTIGLAVKITSKSTSNYTVYRWVTEAFDEKWHQQNHQQKNQQKHQQKAGKSTSSRTTNKKEKEEIEKEEIDSLSKDNSSISPPPPKRGKREGVRKESFKYQGKLSNEAFELHKLSVDRNCACSADIIQSWIDELDGDFESVKKEIISVSKLSGIFSYPAMIGQRVSNLKKSFKPEVENRSQKNKITVEKYRDGLPEEEKNHFKIGGDFVKVRLNKGWVDIFYISGDFNYQWAEAKKQFEKIINIKEAQA